MSPSETAQEREVDERYHAYVRGWRDGAGQCRMRREFTQHETRSDISEAYTDGYGAGWRASQRAATDAAMSFGYTPSTLRLQADTGEQ